MANVYEPDWEPRDESPAPFDGRAARVAAQAGARDLGATVYELQRGQATWPLHLHHSNEEMLVVLAGLG